MNICFKNNKLEKSLTVPAEISKTYGNRAKKVNQRMQEIKASANLTVLMTIPAANCHPLSGGRNGQYAIDISGNWRIVFEPDYEPVPVKDDGGIDTDNILSVKILEVTDYHKK